MVLTLTKSDLVGTHTELQVNWFHWSTDPKHNICIRYNFCSNKLWNM